MKRVMFIVALSALSLSYAACDEGVFERHDGLVQDYAPELTVLERSILEFLNHPLTTAEVLDVEVGLDKRAARNLIAHRNGPDGLVDTHDDNLFNSMAEVDGVYWVGQMTLDSLEAYIESQAWTRAPHQTLGVYDGVHFTVNEGHLTVGLANSASHAELADIIGLSDTATELVLKLRPFATMSELAKVYGVDDDALLKLKSAALNWGPNACQTAPKLDDISALSDDFQSGVYLVCAGLDVNGACPEPSALSAVEFVQSEFGVPKRVNECAWSATDVCQREVVAGDCCTVMTLSQACSE